MEWIVSNLMSVRGFVCIQTTFVIIFRISTQIFLVFFRATTNYT